MSKPVCQEIFVLVPGNGRPYWNTWSTKEGVGFASCYLCLIETLHTEEYYNGWNSGSGSCTASKC